MNSIFAALIFSMLFISCSNGNTQPELVDENGKNIGSRFRVPEGFERLPAASGSFASYLRELPLHPQGAIVKYYDGSEKNKRGVYLAVVNMECGKKNLQQCADAVIRLRAEYLFRQERFEEIHFNYTSGFNAAYSKWREGYRIRVSGNNVAWARDAEPSGSYATFRKYLDNVFMYAGTLSLAREMKAVPYTAMQPGDVLIRGGSPGHAVIVVDMAKNQEGKTLYMLAQSYMPAQEIQVLNNPASKGSPWYELDERKPEIVTPEWTFSTADLKRF